MSVKGKVAILDDEPIVCERLKQALEKIGFYVETFGESQTLLDSLADGKFEVLVTDLKMRKPDGLDVLNYVRQHSPGTKVIVITGFATAHTANEAMKAGAVDFIAKPFKISHLRDIIAKIMSSGE
jgi:DNA-binding NtrC family response regulator